MNHFKIDKHDGTLKLVLKREWYDMIASCVKREEYRDLTSYWESRIIEHADCCCVACCPKVNKVQFFCGYAKKRPSMTWEIKEVKRGKGRPDWGAEPGKDYFVIVLGKLLQINNPASGFQINFVNGATIAD